MKSRLSKHFADCVAERRDLWNMQRYAEPATRIAETIVRAISGGRRIFFFGNGGSAAQAQHLAAELSGRFLVDRAPWAAQALSVDPSALTAIANDYGYEHVFERQLKALGQPGDVAVGLTTSGSSPNVVQALRAARERNIISIVLTGGGENTALKEADIAIVGPTGHSWKVQELHLALGHIICELVESALVNSPDSAMELKA